MFRSVVIMHPRCKYCLASLWYGTHKRNRGDYDTSNPPEIRKYLRTYGLIPPNVESFEIQSQRCRPRRAYTFQTTNTQETGLAVLHRKTTAIDKYEYLSHLRNDNVHLFYRLVMDHTKELTPLIYTPVVGEACIRWSEIYSRPEGTIF